MKSILSVMILLVVVVSCKKQNFKDHVGPSICPSDAFAYELQPQLNLTYVNLSNQTLKIQATMNEEISWYVTIKGLTSKSFKKYSGYGKSININWLGNPDTLVFFKAENCEVEVKIACLDDVVVLPFTITNTSNFSYLNYLVYNGDGGALGMGPYVHGNYKTDGVDPALNSPQGGNCYCLYGNSGTTPVWYFGGFGYDLTVTNELKTNPDSVYFNAFVNVKGSQNSIPALNFKEGPVYRAKYLYIYGEGWHYITFKLSEANILNPRDISVINFGLNAYPVQGTSGDMCVDFVILTNDAPFFSVK